MQLQCTLLTPKEGKKALGPKIRKIINNLELGGGEVWVHFQGIFE